MNYNLADTINANILVSNFLQTVLSNEQSSGNFEPIIFVTEQPVWPSQNMGASEYVAAPLVYVYVFDQNTNADTLRAFEQKFDAHEYIW